MRSMPAYFPLVHEVARAEELADNAGLEVEERRARGCQSTLPVRAKTRKQTIRSDGNPEMLCLSNPGRRQTVIFRL